MQFGPNPLLVNIWLADFDHLFLNTPHNLFSRPSYYLREVQKNDPISPLQPKPQDTVDRKRYFPDKNMHEPSNKAISCNQAAGAPPPVHEFGSPSSHLSTT